MLPLHPLFILKKQKARRYFINANIEERRGGVGWVGEWGDSVSKIVLARILVIKALCSFRPINILGRLCTMSFTLAVVNLVKLQISKESGHFQRKMRCCLVYTQCFVFFPIGIFQGIKRKSSVDDFQWLYVDQLIGLSNLWLSRTPLGPSDLFTWE